MTRAGRRFLWLGWTPSVLVAALVLGHLMAYGGSHRGIFLIGRTTDAHHQIELACNACHTSWFGGAEALQQSCIRCHGAALTAAHDAHPAKKFRDPRNADRLEALDAMRCVTCHREHQPEITGAMAVTLPGDYCVACHKDIGRDRPSHRDLAFTSCAAAGCHNFHDNQALYEDFLKAHRDEPAIWPAPRLALLVAGPGAVGPPPRAARPLTAADADAPAEHMGGAEVMADWLGSAHAAAGVNCSGCHRAKGDAAGHWIEQPALAQCSGCHDSEVAGFYDGRHGMRLDPRAAIGPPDPLGLFDSEPLGPMTSALARLPMKTEAHDRALGCTTCHGAHRFDRQVAVVQACLGCHADQHTEHYRQSPHYRLWQAELAGLGLPGSGVTCATCHLPRHQARDDDGQPVIRVAHNQNANLRPNEKMVRSVCLDCHGLGFTLDALADRALIERNFTGQPAGHVESLDWVAARMRARGELTGGPAAVSTGPDNPDAQGDQK